MDSNLNHLDTPEKVRSAINSLNLKEEYRRFADYIFDGMRMKDAYPLVRGKELAPSTTKVQAYRWRSREDVSTYLELKAKLKTMSANGSEEVTKGRILQEEACLAFYDASEVFDPQGHMISNPRLLPEALRRSIKEIKGRQKWLNTANGGNGAFGWEIEYKFQDKGASLNRLEHILGMVKEGPGIQVNLSFKDILAVIDGSTRGVLPADQTPIYELPR